MSTDELVLLKSRGHRLAEMIIFPIAFLPIGPVLRALLGSKYDVFYGLGASFLVIMLVTRLSSQWAGRHGEWVTKAERVRRLLAEATERPWLNALTTTVMLAFMLIGFMLIIEPLDGIGDFYGGPLVTTLFVLAISLIGGARALFAGYSKRQPVIVDEAAPPPGYFWSELCSALPLTYAAYALAALVAFLVAAQLSGSTQSVAFIIVFLVTSQLPLTVLRRAGKRIYPVALDANLGRQIVASALLWGVPMGMMFSAGLALDTFGLRMAMALKIALLAAVMGLSVVAGAAMGAFLYVIFRLSESRKAQ